MSLRSSQESLKSIRSLGSSGYLSNSSSFYVTPTGEKALEQAGKVRITYIDRVMTIFDATQEGSQLALAVIILSIGLLVFFSFFLAFVLDAESCFKKNCTDATPSPVILNDNNRNFVEVGKIVCGLGIGVTSAIIIIASFIRYRIKPLTG